MGHNLMDPDVPLPGWMDRYRASRIARLRALGYSQKEIAAELGVSQQTVSRYLKGINEAARQSENRDQFLGALLAIGGAALIAWLLNQFED
jgi:transcriptional regulator with XRE-family HTH domain